MPNHALKAVVQCPSCFSFYLFRIASQSNWGSGICLFFQAQLHHRARLHWPRENFGGIRPQSVQRLCAVRRMWSPWTIVGKRDQGRFELELHSCSASLCKCVCICLHFHAFWPVACGQIKADVFFAPESVAFSWQRPFRYDNHDEYVAAAIWSA